MAIYSLNHKSIGRATHQPGTASAHLKYITRPRAASEIIAEHMPSETTPAMRWMDAEEQVYDLYDVERKLQDVLDTTEEGMDHI